MCGILGFVHSDTISPDECKTLLRRMGRWQFHRGPDEWGEWFGDNIALGHNRLSIIDIKHGHQPMSTEDGFLQVIFNGEIYNYQELKSYLTARGYKFRTDHSDTEVIVNGYREWGTDLFERLEGMFAIGIWDVQNNSLVIARDRLGIKPLVYAHTKKGFFFSSEPKTLLASGMIERSINQKALVDYFAFRGAVHPDTLITQIKKLPPGTWTTFSIKQGLKEPYVYWRSEEKKFTLSSVEDTENLVLHELEKSVISHCISDVPVGVFLSGGVDSSLIAALMSKHIKTNAFTVSTNSSVDESKYAKAVADHLKISLKVLDVTPNEFSKCYQNWMYYNDDPVSDPSALALMLLSDFARSNGMKVMLSGEGSDEIFGGYEAYQTYFNFVRISRFPILPRLAKRFFKRFNGYKADYISRLPSLNYLGTSHTLPDDLRMILFNFKTCQPVNDSVLGTLAHNPLRRAMIFDQKIRLSNDLLARTDRATMAYSLEARVPFVDRQIVELGNSIPDSFSLRRGEKKWLLKRIAERLLPRQVIYRRKLGFDLPLGEWLMTDFAERIQDNIATQNLDYINYDTICSLYRQLLLGNLGVTATIWQWMVLEEWHRQWMDGAATPRQPNTDYNLPTYKLLFG